MCKYIVDDTYDISWGMSNESASVACSCEGWTFRKNKETCLDAFVMKGLRKIVRVLWTAKNKVGVKAGNWTVCEEVQPVTVLDVEMKCVCMTVGVGGSLRYRSASSSLCTTSVVDTSCVGIEEAGWSAKPTTSLAAELGSTQHSSSPNYSIRVFQNFELRAPTQAGPSLFTAIPLPIRNSNVVGVYLFSPARK